MIFRFLYTCSFFLVFVGNNSYVYVDTSPPVIINCPLDINKSAELGMTRVMRFITTTRSLQQPQVKILIAPSC